MHKRLSLPRIEFLPEKLVDSEEVDGEGEDAFLGDGLHPVGISAEFGKLLDVFPDLRLAGVENMRPIDMLHHAGSLVAVRMAVACQVRALVNDEDLVISVQGELSGEHCAGEAGADDEDFFRQGLEKFLFDTIEHILPKPFQRQLIEQNVWEILAPFAIWRKPIPKPV